MQFKLVLLGVALLTSGLLAYSVVPNIHRTPIVTSQPLDSPETLQVPGSSTLEKARNVTITQGQDNTLLTNITITTPSGSLGSIRFKLFASNNTQTCTLSNPQLLVDQDLSNNSLTIPVSKSGVYCFIYDNLSSSTQKTVRTTASVRSSFVQVRVANDGGMNLAGLGLGAFGFIVALVGVSRKTIIPWE